MVLQVKLPELPYEYNALEPVISKETLTLHHDKHHQTYCDKLNAALESEGIEAESIEDVFTQISSLGTAVRNHGGGFWNHVFYFESLRSPSEENKPTGKVAELIDSTFGSFDKFKEEFSAKAAALFGSGWTWLGLKEDGSLIIHNTANQDNTLMDIMDEKYTPILVIDVWEHAYYVDYQNRRPEHIGKFFSIVNWDKVNERLN